MFGYNSYSVIERLGVVGIICSWDGSYARIMFEDGKSGVDFAIYPIAAVAKFKVIA